MAETSPISVSPGRKLRWYLPTPPALVFIVLAMQGVLFLSEQYHWFWFNERKGYTVLIAVAATAAALLLIACAFAISALFKSNGTFGLATLLLMVPIIAIPCAWLAREMEQAGIKRAFIQQAQNKPRAAVDVERRSDVPLWLTKTFGEEFFFGEIRGLWVDKGEIDLEGVPLESAKSLRNVWLTDSDGVTNESLAQLKRLPQLRRLHLRDSGVTDEGLVHLRGLTELEELTLECPAVADAGLAHLRELTKLEKLSIGCPAVTDAGLIHLRDLHNLRLLSLEGTQVTGAGLEHLAKHSQLRKLYLSDSQLTDEGLEQLASFNQLATLTLSKTLVTDQGVQRLRKALEPYCNIHH